MAEHSCCALPRDPPPVLCRACPAAMSSPLQYSTSVEDNEDALSVGTTPPVDAGAPAYVLPSGHPRFGFMSAPVVTTTPPPFPAGALRRSQSFASTRGLRSSPMSPHVQPYVCTVESGRHAPCSIQLPPGPRVSFGSLKATKSPVHVQERPTRCCPSALCGCNAPMGSGVVARCVPLPELRFHVHGLGWRARVHCWYVLVACLCIPSPLRLRAACTRPRMCFVLCCRLSRFVLPCSVRVRVRHPALWR